jgi:protein-tyrosine kinase
MSLIERVAERMDSMNARPARSPAGASRERAAFGTADAQRRGWAQEPYEARPQAHAPAQPQAPAHRSEPPSPSASDRRESAGGSFTIARARLGRRGFITPETRRSRLSEEMRLLKHQLIRRVGAEGIGTPAALAGWTIMVTSARPREGKSFVALNLALSFLIDEHIPVLLIDADHAHSALDELLGIPRSPGLTDALRDETVSLASLVRRAEDLPLGVIPPGTNVASATDLYAGPRMDRLLTEACRSHPSGPVIIDAPPLLSVTEAMVLATMAAAVLLVVEAEFTTDVTLQSALELLEPCPNVSLVLNKAPRGATERFGSYYLKGRRAAMSEVRV